MKTASDCFHDALRENGKLSCSVPGCEYSRVGLRDLCQEHLSSLAESRHRGAIKASESRRRNNPERHGPCNKDDAIWQSRASSAVNMAVRQGILPSLSRGEYQCSDCSDAASVYDHRDYSLPLDVDPVCRACNQKRGAAKYPLPIRHSFKRIVDKTSGKVGWADIYALEKQA